MPGVAGSLANISFGAPTSVTNLAQGPSTYAFYYSVNDTQAGWANLASRAVGGVNSGGWSCRGFNEVVYFLVEKSTTEMYAGFNGGVANNVPGTVVFTYTGGNTAATDIKCYINGKLVSAAVTQDGVGSNPSDASATLYLGVSRVSNADFSLKGDIMVGVLANRVWSDAEAAEFARDPYSVFAGSNPIPAVSYPVNWTGTSSIAFGGSGSLTGSGALHGSATVTFGGSGVTTTIGQLAGTTAIVFSGTADFGDSQIQSAAPAHRDSRTVDVIFFGPVEEAAALTPANYIMNHGAQVISVTKITATWYRLTTTRLVDGQTYSLSSKNIGLT